MCSGAGFPIAIAAGNAQVPWLEAIEDRLEATAKLLNNATSIRLSGLVPVISSRVQDLRDTEIKASRRYRLVNIYIFVWGE